MNKYDFGGYATKNDVVCADGKTIRANAFKHMDGAKVPIVWQHQHDDPTNVLGHGILEHREDGVYVYGTFNDTQKGIEARKLVQHGDIESLSIYANKIKQKRDDVVHGFIREVSLVMFGANPEAQIIDVNMAHSDEDYATEIVIAHAVPIDDDDEDDDYEDEEETVQDVFNTMNEKQKTVVYAIVNDLIENDKDTDDVKHSEDGGSMKRNMFEGSTNAAEKEKNARQEARTIIQDAAKNNASSLKDAFIAHAGTYGVTNIETLFPEAEVINKEPEFLKRDTGWVGDVLSGVKKSPFSRIKTRYADITEDSARAKGYIKGTQKLDEVFAVFDRTTTPYTIYKKQKLDRDDILDITDFAFVDWIKSEMRMMLDEEIARAILIGDGRAISDPQKIKEEHVRPIATDDHLYAHKVVVPSNVMGKNLIEAMIRARKNYKGSGMPTLYTSDAIIIDMLLVTDKIGRRLYNSELELATALRVNKIVPVEVFETKPDLLGIFVNLNDYVVGANKGGEINFFDDFDIDFNQYKYLYETRISGALTKLKSAVVFWRAEGITVTPEEPTFNSDTGVITIPNTTGVQYYADGVGVPTGNRPALQTGQSSTIYVEPKAGYSFAANQTVSWEFSRE